MTKNNFKFFLKKPSELAESSELPASGLAKHPCIMIMAINSKVRYGYAKDFIISFIFQNL